MRLKLSLLTDRSFAPHCEYVCEGQVVSISTLQMSVSYRTFLVEGVSGSTIMSPQYTSSQTMLKRLRPVVDQTDIQVEPHDCRKAG